MHKHLLQAPIFHVMVSSLFTKLSLYNYANIFAMINVLIVYLVCCKVKVPSQVKTK